jgi:glucose/arabinose dehydrogenase
MLKHYSVKLFYSLLWLTGIYLPAYQTVLAQTVPVPLRSDIKISPFINVPPNCSRLGFDPTNRHIMYINQNGNVYDVRNSQGTYISTLKATSANHGITLLQGMAFKGTSLFLIGNIKTPNAGYVGKVMKGVKQANGDRVWSTVMTTATYGLTNTAFDHGFSGITVSPDSNYLFINSGSRTDHGEVQSSGGLRPGLREEPLTSAIFRIPINSNNLVLPNDSAQLASLGYLYADGTRNSFDLAFGTDGNLYGTENSGDRDDPEELNWIRQGRFYGFPWRMGGNNTPMQYPGYDPAADKLVDHNSTAYINGFFYNDPSYPKRPNRTFTEPIVNLGPDADKYRDSIAGTVKDAGAEGINISTFTSHRSPLGLVFDRDSLLADEFKGHGFVTSWTSTGTSTMLGPFGGDPGQDLLHIQFIYDSKIDNYKIQTHRLIRGFNNPIDAEMVGNLIYVLEYGGSSPKIWKVEMPLAPNCGPQAYITKEQYNNIPGKLITDLTSNSNYPDHPSVTTRLTSFEVPINAGENFGARIRGYITPPTTGNYTFWIAGDDQAELWLSTDSTTAHKRKIASATAYTLSRQYTKYPAQKSVLIALTAGKKYYIEALQKESTAGDNLSVQWQLPNGTIELPIPCTRLSVYKPAAPLLAVERNTPPPADSIITDPLQVFPNPATTVINIKLASRIKDGGEITLTNMMGFRVYRSTVNIFAGDNQIPINSNFLNHGVYILRLKNSIKTYEKKVIIE